MSFNSFNDQSRDHSRKNYAEVVAPVDKSLLSNIKPPDKMKKPKKPTTISLSEKHLEKLDRIVKENGYRSRSDFISSVIDSM